MSDRQSPWNSLELAKLIAAVSMPIALALVGFAIKAELARQDQARKTIDRIVGKRLDVYVKVGTKLNEIYCFIQKVGTWKKYGPQRIIDNKRDVDTEMYVNRAIWSENTWSAYQEYMKSAFKTYQGLGKDAAIRTDKFTVGEASESASQDEPSWGDWDKNKFYYFSEIDTYEQYKKQKETLVQHKKEHQERYDALMLAISRDLEFVNHNEQTESFEPNGEHGMLTLFGQTISPGMNVVCLIVGSLIFGYLGYQLYRLALERTSESTLYSWSDYFRFLVYGAGPGIILLIVSLMFFITATTSSRPNTGESQSEKVGDLSIDELKEILKENAMKSGDNKISEAELHRELRPLNSALSNP